MNAAELMSSEFAVVEHTSSVADAAKMMRSQNTGCLVVVEAGALAGIITERDMVLGCLIDGHLSQNCEVSRHMTVLSDAAAPLTDVGDALLIMMDNGVSYLPVVNEDGSISGLLHSEDLSLAIEQASSPISALDGELITI